MTCKEPETLINLIKLIYTIFFNEYHSVLFLPLRLIIYCYENIPLVWYLVRVVCSCVCVKWKEIFSLCLVFISIKIYTILRFYGLYKTCRKQMEINDLSFTLQSTTPRHAIKSNKMLTRTILFNFPNSFAWSTTNIKRKLISII